jgi:hypothetical protein
MDTLKLGNKFKMFVNMIKNRMRKLLANHAKPCYNSHYQKLLKY